MKKYLYEPMNATEYFLYEIAKSNDEIIDLLRKQVESKKEATPIEVKAIVEEKAPVEVKAPVKKTRAKKKVTE